MPAVYRLKTSPNWYCMLYSGGRKRQVSLRTPLRREAEARAARLRYGSLPELIRAVATPPPVPLSELWDIYAQSQTAAALAASTLESYHQSFLRFVRWTHGRPSHAAQVTPQVAAQYLGSIPAPRTANLARGILSLIWKAAALPDPWASARPRPLRTVPMRGLADSEIRAVLSIAPPDWRDLILLAVHTGLRLKDCVNLRRDEVKPTHLELRPAKTKRTGRAVYIPLHPELAAVLASRRGRSPLYFPSLAADYARSRAVVAKRFSRLLEAAKIAGTDSGRAGFHSLRVSFATRLAVAGVPRPEIQAMTGHSTAAMASHYIDSPEALSLALVPPVSTPNHRKTTLKRPPRRAAKTTPNPLA